jgi:hypothetical protein
MPTPPAKRCTLRQHYSIAIAANVKRPQVHLAAQTRAAFNVVGFLAQVDLRAFFGQAT